jgi:O-antigen/teichoic acid export membrane protein
MLKIFQYLITNLFNPSHETKSTLLKSLSSLFVKIFGIIFTLSISIFLGRTIGAEGIGLLSISKQFVGLVLLFSLFGVGFVIIKEISIHKQKNNLLAIGQTMNSVYFFNGLISLLLTLLTIFAVPWIANSFFNNPDLEFPLLVSVLVIPFQLFSRLFGSALLGFNKVWQSALVDNVLSAFLSLLMLLAFYFFKDESINVNNVAIIYAVSRIITMCVVGIYWRINFNYKAGNTLIIRKLLKTSTPLFVVSITSFLMYKIDSLILGTFIDAKAVGVYVVAASVSLLCNFLLQISSQAISPRFAVLYSENKIKDLQVLLKQVTLVLTILGGFFFLIIIFFGSTILSFWGEEFRSGYYILLILTFSQVYNISTGPVGTLLIMSGYEKILMKLNIYLSIFSLLLGSISAYFFGVIAFAVAAFVIRITGNSIKILLCKKNLNISMF